MKFLAITLALAIFAGSPAFVLGEQQPVSRMDQLKRDLFEYFRDITRVYENQKNLVRRLDAVQAVEEQAVESFDNITRRFRKLGEEMPKEVKEGLDLALGVPTGVAEMIFDAFQDFAHRLEPATRELYDALEPVMASRVEPALGRVKPFADMVRAKIHEVGQNHTERLKARLGELNELGPQVRRVMQQIEEVQVSLQPLADELQSLIQQKMEGAVSAARPYVSPVLKAAEEYSAGLKKWVARPMFPRQQ